MFLSEAINTAGIIAIAVGSVVFLCVVIFLLTKYVFIRKSYERQIKELDRKYSFLNALLIGQDSQYIKRLEMISRTNLLYGEKYDQFAKRFKHVKEIDDAYANGVIKQLKNLVQGKKYSQIKKALVEGKSAIATFEKNVNDLDLDLKNLVRPEEEARQFALTLKERLRDIKQTYSTNVTDLDPVSGTFTRLFDKLDRRFLDFESYLEGAEYDEARAVLPEIDKVLKQLSKVMNDLPDLCVLVSHVIPSKIKALKQESEDLHSKDYPLHHLMLTNEFSVYKDKLARANEYLVNLQLKAVRQESDSILHDIEDMHNKFQKEIEAKEFFNANCEEVYRNVLDLEKRFLRMCALLPEMNRVYRVSDSAEQNIDSLKEGVNRLGASKRALDSYIHSSTPQAYSILQAKLENLMKDYEEVDKGTQDFKVYIDSLKLTSEEAYGLVFAYYYRLKNCEQQLASFGISACKEKYQNQIEQCYNLLNNIEAKIKVTPIDTAYINQQVENLKNIANELFDNVAKDATVIQMAESAILIANRDRKHQNNVHHELLAAEQEFFEGNFDKTYYDVVNIIKKNHVEDNQG